MFARGLLPEAIRDLSTCIQEDGNDGAHAGTLEKPDAEDLLDFTTTLLQRLEDSMTSAPSAMPKAEHWLLDLLAYEESCWAVHAHESGR